MSRKGPEARIQAAILEWSRLRPDLTLWRRNVAALKVDGRFMRFGKPGMSDLTGHLIPSGRRLEVEVKAPGGRLTVPQRAWGDFVESTGGIFLVARSVADVESALRGKCDGCCEPGHMLTANAYGDAYCPRCWRDDDAENSEGDI